MGKRCMIYIKINFQICITINTNQWRDENNSNEVNKDIKWSENGFINLN